MLKLSFFILAWLIFFGTTACEKESRQPTPLLSNLPHKNKDGILVAPNGRPIAIPPGKQISPATSVTQKCADETLYLLRVQLGDVWSKVAEQILVDSTLELSQSLPECK